MIIFYSGNSSKDALPECIIAERKPSIMLTFFDFSINHRSTERRFEAHKNNRLAKLKKKKDKTTCRQ